MSKTMERIEWTDSQESSTDVLDVEDIYSPERIKEQFDAIIATINDRFQTLSPVEVEQLSVEAADKTWSNKDDIDFKPWGS